MSEHTPCERWEREGLLAAERGEALDPHFADCADCRAAQAAHQALAARVVTAGAGWQPPGDWEARVFARIAREQPARRFAWWYALFPALAVAGLVVYLALPKQTGNGTLPGADPALSLTIGVVDAAQRVRGENPKPGDGLSLRVAAGQVSHIGLRVYRDDRTLVYACGHAEACPQVGADVSTQVRMDAPGQYRTLAIGGRAEIPPPAGSLDADLARARGVGLQVVLGEPVDVY